MTEPEHPGLAKLRALVGGKIVCFQSPGPSIKVLEQYIHTIPEDVVWAAHNVFLPTERILQSIDRELDIVYASSWQVLENYYDKIGSFLERAKPNLFLTTTGGMIKLDSVAQEYRERFKERLVIMEVGDGPAGLPEAFSLLRLQDEPFVFSFIFMFLGLLKAGASKIICFGLDGGWSPGHSEWYYGVAEDYPHNWFNGQPGGYGSEISYLSRSWEGLLNECGIEKSAARIINCSPNSQIKAFPLIDYCDLALQFQEGSQECPDPFPSSSPA